VQRKRERESKREKSDDDEISHCRSIDRSHGNREWRTLFLFLLFSSFASSVDSLSMCSIIRAEATLIGERESEWMILLRLRLLLFSSRRFLSVHRQNRSMHTHQETKDLFIIIVIFSFLRLCQLYQRLHVDFNKTIAVSTQLTGDCNAFSSSSSVYRLMATFCSYWLKAVVNNNE